MAMPLPKPTNHRSEANWDLNPTERYQDTRHNLGFMCSGPLVPHPQKRFKSDDLYDYIILKDAVLLKPHLMNRSADAPALPSRDGISPRAWWCMTSELPAGVCVRSGGGDGGHNGIKSLLRYCLRIRSAHPPGN